MPADRRHPPHELGEGRELATEDVRLAETPTRADERDSRRDVLDVRHVQPEVAEGQRTQPAVCRFAQLAAERRMVPRPVHAAGHRDQHRRSGVDPLLSGEVRPVLRLVVEGDVPIRPRPLVRFVDDAVAGVAEGVDRGDMDDPRDAGRHRRVEQPFGGGDVGGLHRRAVGRPDPDPVVAGQVVGDLAAAERIGQGGRVEEVADDHLGPGVLELGRRAGDRAIARTSMPDATSPRTRLRPMNPPPPVTRARIGPIPERIGRECARASRRSRRPPRRRSSAP